MISNAELSAQRDHTLSVARALYDGFRRRGETVSVAHLERMLYLCHGWTLACTQGPLLFERFQVELQGPTLYSLAGVRRRYGRESLPMHDGDAIFGGDCIPYGDSIRTLEVIQRVLGRYGCYTSQRLGEITRMEGGAFQRALASNRDVLGDGEIRRDFVALGLAGREQPAPQEAA